MTGYRGATVLGVCAIAVAAGCAAPGSRLESGPVVVQGIGVAIHEPVWSYATNTLIGLTSDRRIAKVTALGSGSRPMTMFSARFADLGENIEISPVDSAVAFVAEPATGQVARIRLDNLTVAGSLPAGPSPSRLALDAGLRVLLALSKNGATVTPVDLHRGTALPPTAVDAGTGADLEGSNRGRDIAFHVFDSQGVTLYKGPSSPTDEKGQLGAMADAVAGDGAKTTRLYLAERGTYRLLAIDSKRGGEGLTIVGSAALDAPIRALGTDDTRIYAATDHALTVLESRSFEGYRDGAIPVIRTIDFSTALPSGQISGLALGPHRVYLTARNQPVVISLPKPKL